MQAPDTQFSEAQSRQIAALIREELARRRISRQQLADQAKLSISVGRGEDQVQVLMSSRTIRLGADELLQLFDPILDLFPAREFLGYRFKLRSRKSIE